MQAGIGEFIRAFEAEKDAIMQDVVTRVSNGLVRESLVDTGDLVADWDVALGHWPADSKQAPDPRRSTTRARLKSGFKDVKFGAAVFFENNDPAALQQEFGNLKRQPNGLARLIARRFKSFVKGAGVAAANRVKKRLVFD